MSEWENLKAKLTRALHIVPTTIEKGPDFSLEILTSRDELQ